MSNIVNDVIYGSFERQKEERYGVVLRENSQLLFDEFLKYTIRNGLEIFQYYEYSHTNRDYKLKERFKRVFNFFKFI